ncbi:MAG TPA: phosphoribosylformylglycinamidine synthase subunit PurQ [Candidatus Cybelea sp.]|jgi:phosphoribosylformylglycinamidine synthase I|nr:phosphoribosylformylglycinamidine synthase subunit PurQ [Candidatus Cybelea sp.]
MKFGVVVFPGSNCDHDAFYAIGNVFDKPVEFIWHQSQELGNSDAIILPGGFAYGDYLRTGAIARFSPVMKSVEKFANGGGLVLGICNGFQILLEAGLLPGAMMRNRGLRYICRHVHIRVEQTDTPFTNAAAPGQILSIPIAHNDGNYTSDETTLAELEKNRQVIFRYTTPDGSDDAAGNPNGSMNNIAGISNRERNVAGLMPHPERAVESVLGSADGSVIFKSMIRALAGARRPPREDRGDFLGVQAGLNALSF